MIDEFAKEYLHGELRDAREVLWWKLDGAIGTAAGSANVQNHPAFWAARRAGVERAARRAAEA
ncbi:hypothetical protein [Paractinoplanes lichenicola]|uniref:hypothetical protein n=1 Tax=Paractinoplanes lichenicola TaxID=2802976 RepID=UPI001F446D2D|nr:hypothetical protein [Actinoplanes lichenicola]